MSNLYSDHFSVGCKSIVSNTWGQKIYYLFQTLNFEQTDPRTHTQKKKKKLKKEFNIHNPTNAYSFGCKHFNKIS